MILRFLGTGASGGTPGQGRSRRRESSLLVRDGRSLLIDVTRDFEAQAEMLESLDGVLLTHAHRDAAGGMARLRRWWQRRSQEPLAVHGHPQTLARLEERYARQDPCLLVPVEPGDQLELGLWVADSGADLLVIDGAMWGRDIFSHLRADRALPELCRWDVERILLTQIGRTAPAHQALEHEVARLCARAAPAHDGLQLRYPEVSRRRPPAGGG